MVLPKLLALSLVVAPSFVQGAIFPEGSLVKMIDHKGFKTAMKENMTSLVAFVAPWCGHCQRMAPEYSKAALGLHPLVPLYAVDCDASKNKRLCADQGVQGFPTVKLFPRGKDMEPVLFQGPQRSASEFFYFAKRGIPDKIKKIPYIEEFEDTINEKKILKRPRAVLMNKSNKKPLLWSSLANKYRDDIVFFTHRDRRGKSSVKLGFEAGEENEPKILIYPPGETKPVQFQGLMKFDSLSTFFDSLIDGTADLASLNAAAAAEEFVPDPKELEIEKQQEAEMLKLAHGGFSNMIDFEAAVRDGSAKDFHGKHGYPGMMGGVPPKKKEDSESKETTSSKSKKKSKMPMTDESGQIVLDVPTGTETAAATATATEEDQTVVESSLEPEPEPEVVEDETVDDVAEPEPEAAESVHPKDEL